MRISSQRISEEAYAREASAGRMGVFQSTEEIAVDELHRSGAIVGCDFVSRPNAHEEAADCPYEEMCDGNCLLQRES